MNRRMIRPILLPLALGLAAAVPARSQVLLSESFESATFGPSSTVSTSYAGDASWVIADPTSPSPMAWSVNTGLGWTANDAGGNQYLFADGNDVSAPPDNTIFRTSGWNPGGVEILSVGFLFAMDPGSQQSDNWGAIILSPSTFADTAAPGADDQSIHIRIQHSGGTGTLGTSATVGGYGGSFGLGPGFVHELEILYNGSLATWEGLDSGKGSIFLNGIAVVENEDLFHLGSGAGSDARTPLALNLLEFRGFGSLDVQGDDPMSMWIDNVTITDPTFVADTVIPEPGSFALIAGMGAILLLRRRRRTR